MRALGLVLLLVAGCYRSAPVRCASDADCRALGGVCDLVTRTCATAPPDASVGDLAEPASDLAVDAGAPDLAVTLDLAPLDSAMPRGCDASSQCLDVQPVCGGSTCRSCGSGDRAACAARDPANPRCDETTGRCAPCRTSEANLDCPDPSQPVCGGDGRCRGCRAHSECAIGVCKPGGACAAASEIALVDDGGQMPNMCAAMGTHDGMSALTAFCDVQDAIMTSARPYVKVTGRGAFSGAYGAINVTRSVTVVGPGRAASTTATLKANGGHVVTVGDGVTVTLDGLDLTGSPLAVEGVFCQPATNATLTVLNSAIHGNGGVGIRTDKCSVTLDANEIDNNSAGGLNIQPSSPFTYSITNNLIYSNGFTGPGIWLANSGTGTFAFNTVADNHWTGNIGGIACTGIHLIQASIIWNNGQSASTSIDPNCHLQLCDIDEAAPGPGNFDADPMFAGAPDYHLVPGSQCADRIPGPMFDGGTLTLPDHDAYGNPRPHNTGFDVGAHEL
jgi:hypothetical protein